MRQFSCFLSRGFFPSRYSIRVSTNINAGGRCSFPLVINQHPNDHMSLLQHRLPAFTIVRTFAKKKRKASITQDFKTINDLLHTSYDNLSPAEIAAVWTCIPRLLTKSKAHRSSDGQRMLRSKQINEDREFQIWAIVNHTINSLELMTPKDLANVVHALGRILSRLDTTANNRSKRLVHQAFCNVLLDEELNLNKRILLPFENACKKRLPFFDIKDLSNVSDAYAMMNYDPIFGDGETLFNGISSETMSHLDSLDPKSVSIILRSFATINKPTTLFQWLGDTIVDTMYLDEFSPKYISDLTWAYATINKQHPALFETIANQIVDMKHLKSFQSSILSNVLWSYALLNERHSALFHKIGDAIITSKDLSLRSFQPEDLAKIVWAFSKMNVEHPRLFGKVADAILQSGDISTLRPEVLSKILWAYAFSYQNNDCLNYANMFDKRLFKKVGDSLAFADLEACSSETLSNAVWAFASTNTSHPALFQKVGDVIVDRKDLTLFSPDDLSNIAWAYATLNESHHPFLMAIRSHICNLDSLEMFSSRNLANLTWLHVLEGNNSEIFLKIGNALATRNDLASLDSLCLLDILAAFVMAELPHADIFKTVGDALLCRDDLRSLSPSVFMLTVLPYATMNKHHPEMNVGESCFEFLKANAFDLESFKDIREGTATKTSKVHVNLLKNLGDKLIQWNHLSLHESHYLAILLESFSAAGVHNTSLMSKIGDIVASRSDLNTLTPQVLSNTVHAFVNRNCHHPNLFQRIGDILTSHGDLLTTSHEVLSRIILSYSSIDKPHHQLLQRIGDVIVERDDLHTVSTKSLSDTICAYSTAGVGHTGLLNKIGDTIALRDDCISDLNIPDILWAYVKADNPHPKLYCKLCAAEQSAQECLVQAAKGISFHEETGQGLEAIINLLWSYTFNTQEKEFRQKTDCQLFQRVGDAITNLNVLHLSVEDMIKAVWTLASMKVHHPALFKKIGDNLADRKATDEFSRIQISQLIWAFNASSEVHHHLFETMAHRIAQLGGLHTFEPGDMAHISRAFAVADIDSELIFDENFIEELHKQRQMKIIDYHSLRPLYQWHLWRVGEKRKSGLPEQLQMDCRKAFSISNQNMQSSNFQKDVIFHLSKLGTTPIQDYFTRTGYSIDALVRINGKKVGIEVDGPCHFVERKPNSSTLLKRRLIKANDNISVVSVPYWEWNRLGKNEIKKEKYLRSLLGLKVTQLPL